MTKKQYTIEREGQIDFFNNYHIPYNDDDSILIDNTDGVYHGNILEFKLNINNTGKVLLQAIKYLSKMRIKGESVPARILLIDLNATKIYVYNSKDYIKDIQKVYIGAASVGNSAFSHNVTPIQELDYMDMSDSAEVQKLLSNKVPDENAWYIPIDINEDCIVGWAKRYYAEVPNATKGDFLGDGTGKINVQGEIRDPRHFKGLINPYTSPTNERFKYLMDCLNSQLTKKDLGAFYTPIAYCNKAAELVEKAVERVPDGNDYVIIDRCAGTGNLESALINKFDKNGEELISHCVVSTYEYYEYKVLSERIGDKVRNIIPPTEANVVFENGNISNVNALSKDFIENPIIKKYLSNDKCTVILFENPPYSDSSSSTFNDGDKTKQYKTNRKGLFVTKEYIKSMSAINEKRNSSQELSNLFIWSGFEYYLRQDTDSYIVFSPVKYFKSIHLVKKQMLGGFAFNRKYFHATSSVISCVLWSNVNDATTESWNLDIIDINSNNELLEIGNISIRKVYKTLADSIKKISDSNDVITNICCASNGYPELYISSKGRKPIYNDNIIGYYVVGGFALDSINRCLVRCNWKKGLEKSMGGHLRKENYKEILPMFCAKLYPQDNWYEKDVYFTTSDGNKSYLNDSEFLKSCLIYTCLSNQNKCLSFNGMDDRYYRNELCFDASNGDTIACVDLASMTLDSDEITLLEIWKNILNEAKKTKNYDSTLTYGVYHITKELNTSHKIGSGKSQQTIYDYPNLNSYLDSLRNNLKTYYKTHILEKLFKYELLK